ncbi:Hypothetical predicted protein, partial [Paramuricea clavata]
MPRLFQSLCIVISICIITYGYIVNKELLVNFGFALLGVVLASIFRCLCNFLEELFQVIKSRNDYNISELFTNSFSGIQWKPVIPVVIIAAIPCALAKNSSFNLEDAILILSGIGVVPLIAYLLKLNAQSDPAYTLAFNYNITYLEKALPIFSTSFCDGEKLILLFWINYNKGTPLSVVDSNITKITDNDGHNGYFTVYKLKYHGIEYRRVIHFAEEPLETLKRMCGHSKELRADQLDHQVQSLHKHLSKILTKDQCFGNKCIPILISKYKSLENGGLVEQIMSASLPPLVSPSPHLSPSHRENSSVLRIDEDVSNPVSVSPSPHLSPSHPENSPALRIDEDVSIPVSVSPSPHVSPSHEESSSPPRNDEDAESERNGSRTEQSHTMEVTGESKSVRVAVHLTGSREDVKPQLRKRKPVKTDRNENLNIGW